MAISFVRSNPLAPEPVTVRPGDVVFHYNKARRRFPLHVGIYVGREKAVAPEDCLSIRSLPGHPRGSDYLADAEWGTPGEYEIHFIGQRLDVDPVVVKEVLLISSAQLLERSQIAPPCKWIDDAELVEIDESRKIGDGIPVFVRGTCAQFVEFLYEKADLELIATDPDATGPWPRKATFDPGSPKRIYPATQIHVFWAGKYSLRTAWARELCAYDDCIFGTRSSTI